MKVRLPKSYNDISKHDKEIINQVMTEEVQKQVNHNMAELQKLWLQFACIVLHRNFEFDKEHCLLFLANWREVYRHNNKLKDKQEQTDYLTEEMNKIFGVGGYPKEYVERLEDMK